ncbi:IclR family transcriptional regulator [Salinibaculum rarum]|uniref:IclR family transcriptional regulator n=1 Tax=Salinibaculum rarum TaxID=3058903 RepID=UPI00265DEC37|nr:IclR family transcriptional regulator [Salinibaculum sp. KK48]
MASKGTVGSDERVLDIIEALKAQRTAGVTELAEAVDMPKSTVHVHLSTLKDRGYVVQDEAQKYQLSLRFLDVGMEVREMQDMYDEVVPKLDEIADETNEKVWWITEENDKAIFLAKSLGSRAIRTNSRIGQHTELYELAGGMAILSVLPEQRRRDIIDGYDYPLPDGRSREELESELADVKERGVAYGTEQFLKGVTGVGAPLTDNAGNVYGAISISGPADRLDYERIESDLADLVRGISGELRVNLSYR